jgi:hypothetical protein
MEPSPTDEIIAEIHAIRQEHAARFAFDIERILADLKAFEQQRTEQGWPLDQGQRAPILNHAAPMVRFADR